MPKRNYIKLIFGLKLKQLRQNKKMSLSELASKSNLSVSYLNEIESGKKYPKIDKIAVLAKSLDVTYDELVSLKLMRNLAPIEELLDSNLLEQLPLDHYGLDMNKLIRAISSSSLQLSVLISTFIETAKSSEISQNNFSRTALRTFKEFNENYFEELEDEVNKFIQENRLSKHNTLNYNRLKPILVNKYNYEVDTSSLNKYPEFNDIRALTINKTQNKLMLNDNLETHRKAFILAKELAYNYLDIKERSYIFSSMRLNTYDHLVNYFYTSYFATALIINKAFLIPDLKKIFGLRKWNEDKFLSLLDKYNATPEMFFQRITNLLAKDFGLNKFFFLRFNHEIGSKSYNLSKEVRLNTRRNPGGYKSSEHYCRRWVSISALNMLEKKLKEQKDSNGKSCGILHSTFHHSKDEYLCISVAQRASLSENNIYSVTLGFQIDEKMKQIISFWNDPEIPKKTVNDTCETCTIKDCTERVAPPTSAERIEKSIRLEEAIRKLEETN